MPKGDNYLGPKQLRERNDSELRSLIASKLEDLQKASFKHKLGQLRETHTLIFNARLDAALTALFMTLVAVVVLDAARVWWNTLRPGAARLAPATGSAR